jgi:hypothetical protein
MSIKINDDLMRLEINGKAIATAWRREGGWWEVTHWPRFFDRNQAITALTVTELLETGHSDDDPLIVALREELR